MGHGPNGHAAGMSPETPFEEYLNIVNMLHRTCESRLSTMGFCGFSPQRFWIIIFLIHCVQRFLFMLNINILHTVSGQCRTNNVCIAQDRDHSRRKSLACLNLLFFFRYFQLMFSLPYSLVFVSAGLLFFPWWRRIREGAVSVEVVLAVNEMVSKQSGNHRKVTATFQRLNVGFVEF